MGRPSDPEAVVDSQAKVFGVSGLRVVDASSFALLRLDILRTLSMLLQRRLLLVFSISCKIWLTLN